MNSSAENARKSILARGCDPEASSWAARTFPELLGGPEYVPTTDDADFRAKLESRSWSVVYFAPGACRFSAARRPIPGADESTAGWTLEEYRQLVFELQGPEVRIVETAEESRSIELLKHALQEGRETAA